MIDPTIIARPVHLERPAPPEEAAPALLLAIDRGALGEVRIRSITKAGRKLVDVRFFERRGRSLHQTDRGFALRIGELADVMRVLEAARVASTDGTEGRGRR